MVVVVVVIVVVMVVVVVVFGIIIPNHLDININKSYILYHKFVYQIAGWLAHHQITWKSWGPVVSDSSSVSLTVSNWKSPLHASMPGQTPHDAIWYLVPVPFMLLVQ